MNTVADLSGGQKSAPVSARSRRIHEILLIYILLAAAYFRFTGLYWGEFTYMHPDERFLVWVGSDISPVKSLSEYFDTANSSLNPHNRGHGFYVYGTLPMFLARYLVEWIYGHSGFDEMTRVGRALSALADLGTVWLVYLVARRLFDGRTAVLAAAFSAAVVLQIQQAHFFTMDSFLNALMFLAFYFAVLVLTDPRPWQKDPGSQKPAHLHLLWPSLGFGVSLGLAMATKVNALPMAVALPAAMLIGWLRTPAGHLSAESRERQVLRAFGYLALAAVVSVLVFRIFQPYAFSGPGFFGLKPNPQWIANLQEQAAQRGGDVDFPPNMQWARRPIWFSAQNLTLWGLGLPLGLLAWAGFMAAGWRLWRGWQEQRHGSQPDGLWQPLTLLWLWTAIYFVWQSLQRNPTMRYQLPIYPTLTILAAWAVTALYQYARPKQQWLRLIAILISGSVLLSTYAYAFAFTQIYVRPFTRAEASRWIYRNIPGPINLLIQTPEGMHQQPLSMPYQQLITPGMPYQASFQVRLSGELQQILLPHVLDQTGEAVERTLTLEIMRPGETQSVASATLTAVFDQAEHPYGGSHVLLLQPGLTVQAGEQFLLRLSLGSGQAMDAPPSLAGNLSLRIQPTTGDGTLPQMISPAQVMLTPNLPFSVDFNAEQEGQLTELVFSNLSVDAPTFSSGRLRVQLQDLTAQTDSLFTTLQPVPEGSPDELLFSLKQPLPVWLGHAYRLTLQLQPAGGSLSLRGAPIANEGDWDDGLPLRLEGYDGYGGIYPPDLNLNMYWDDNQEKVERFIRILSQSDYLVISSNRQWGSLPRLPERFPMTTEYYRLLLGCPLEWDIVYCYRIAQPGMFQGRLGFELVRVFESPPTLFGLTINDQFAEEAFTVYDHPKVFIFQKQVDAQTSQELLAQLRAVDLSHIVRKPPMRYGPQPANLLLPPARWVQQQQGGTWAELFDPQSALNRSQTLAVIVWYLTITLLGWIVYPLLRLAVPGLADRGYPLARLTGLLLLSYLVWLGASLGLTFTRGLISAMGLLLFLGGALATVFQRHDLRQELRLRGRYLLAVEGLALAFFLIFLLIRWGNPDLWHPWKGGEKPMDFSYFNAVLKSSSFPPYDPWYAGGYLNYYYYGFVLVGVPVKWLGIVPAVAYNLILPTLASLIGLGAFSVAWNLTGHFHSESDEEGQRPEAYTWLAAIGASLGMVLLGNLGTVRMVFQGFQRLAAPESNIANASLLTRWVWAIRGFFMNLQGASLPYGIGDWYWIPSRAIPAPNDVEPITEFPLFTLLYADLHAHLLALPITLLALALAMAIVLGRARWPQRAAGLLWLFLSALAIGALRPTNTWDFPPYLLLGMAAVGYALWRNPPRSGQNFPEKQIIWRGALAAGGALLLALLAFWLYQPYSQWYLLGYTKVALWKGTHTPLNAYLTHWGLFLFLLILWLAWETRDWLASTPVSALRRLNDYLPWIYTGLVLLSGAIVGLSLLKVRIAWFVLPLAAWCGILLLRPKQPISKQIVLFLTGAGLILTLVVEVIVLVGDIGRMNTVFKFYLQVWTLFSVSAAAALGWLIKSLPADNTGWRRILYIGLSLLVSGAALFTLTGTMAKISDRMAEQAPNTLDGMAFMPYASYTDEWGPMALEQDYQAILWLQENVKGSPVIVEANLRNLYRWGSRMTIYTGLPGVVGWEWHQQQQRAVVPGSWVSNRIAEVDSFYLTTDLQEALNFLRKYQVRYIILGQQERGHYAGAGLDKFSDLNGLFWQEVFRYQDTVIYAVLDLDQVGGLP